MKFKQAKSRIFVPDNVDPKTALKRTTHLALGAHQDDLEIMAIDGILHCFQQKDKWFTGVIVSDGSGSSRTGIYADFTNEEMNKVRDIEQEKAAILGDYAAQIFLDYSSSMVKDSLNKDVTSDIEAILHQTLPEVVYIHNLADKHPTHIGVAVKTIQAIRNLPEKIQPKKLFGCEVWRGLDWMMDHEKVIFDCSHQKNLQQALVGVFDSQISGGKRYDLATMSRRQTNATYFASHDVDQISGAVYAMDLTELITNPTIDIKSYVLDFINRFAEDVSSLIDNVL